MAVDFSGLNDAVIEAFAETCTFTTNTGSHELECVFYEPYTGMGVGNQPVDNPDLSVDVKTTELEATGADHRDTVVIRGDTYTIVSMQPDEANLTNITLSKYGN